MGLRIAQTRSTRVRQYQNALKQNLFSENITRVPPALLHSTQRSPNRTRGNSKRKLPGPTVPISKLLTRVRHRYQPTLVTSLPPPPGYKWVTKPPNDPYIFKCSLCNFWTAISVDHHHHLCGYGRFAAVGKIKDPFFYCTVCKQPIRIFYNFKNHFLSNKDKKKFTGLTGNLTEL